MAVCVKETHE